MDEIEDNAVMSGTIEIAEVTPVSEIDDRGMTRQIQTDEDETKPRMLQAVSEAER